MHVRFFAAPCATVLTSWPRVGSVHVRPAPASSSGGSTPPCRLSSPDAPATTHVALAALANRNCRNAWGSCMCVRAPLARRVAAALAAPLQAPGPGGAPHSPPARLPLRHLPCGARAWSACEWRGAGLCADWYLIVAANRGHSARQAMHQAGFSAAMQAAFHTALRHPGGAQNTNVGDAIQLGLLGSGQA